MLRWFFLDSVELPDLFLLCALGDDQKDVKKFITLTSTFDKDKTGISKTTIKADKICIEISKQKFNSLITNATLAIMKSRTKNQNPGTIFDIRPIIKNVKK